MLPAPVQVPHRASHCLHTDPSRKKFGAWSEQEATQVREVPSTEKMLEAHASQAVFPDPLHSLQRGSQEEHWLREGAKYWGEQEGQLEVPEAVQVRQPVEH